MEKHLGIWFCLLGGAIAWTLHLLICYGLSEAFCIMGPPSIYFLGVNLLAYVLGLVTLVLLGMALAAVVLSRRQALSRPAAAGEQSDSWAFTARAGFLANVVFSISIMAQSLPIFTLLGRC